MVTGAIFYSIFNSMGYGVAFSLFFLEAKRKKYPLEPLLWILFGSLLGGLIGSKLRSTVFVYHQYFTHHPYDILVPQVGGKTLVGGLIGGYIGTVIAKKIVKFERSTGDLFAPGLALGIAIGRVGCLLNGCCYGRPTNFSWGIEAHGKLVHPTQIYEAIFCFALFIVLWRVRKRIVKDGRLFKLFLLSYCFFRFWVEFLRGDAVPGVLNFSMAQFIACVAFVFLAGEWFYQKGTKQ